MAQPGFSTGGCDPVKWGVTGRVVREGQVTWPGETRGERFGYLGAFGLGLVFSQREASRNLLRERERRQLHRSCTTVLPPACSNFHHHHHNPHPLAKSFKTAPLSTCLVHGSRRNLSTLVLRGWGWGGFSVWTSTIPSEPSFLTLPCRFLTWKGRLSMYMTILVG